MSDSVTSVRATAPRHTTLAGAVGLFALFAGLCAIFALVVTLFEWREAVAQKNYSAAENVLDRFKTSYLQPTNAWQLQYLICRIRLAAGELEKALQSATNLIPSVTWSNVSPAPAIVNGEYTVTNALTGARKFYRLMK